MTWSGFLQFILLTILTFTAITQTSMKIILITGATAGVGKAIAFKFAEHGWNIIITGRREERLKKIEEDIKKSFEVKVLSLCLDVRNKTEVQLAINDLPHDWKKIDVLVNNAGLAPG